VLPQGLLDVIVSDDNAAVKVVRLRIIDDSGMGGMGGTSGGGDEGDEMGAIKPMPGGGDESQVGMGSRDNRLDAVIMLMLYRGRRCVPGADGAQLGSSNAYAVHGRGGRDQAHAVRWRR
jgi:hypothetical protein